MQAVPRRCSVKILFSKELAKLTRNNPQWYPFLAKVQIHILWLDYNQNFITEFSGEFCGSFQKNFFKEHFQVTWQLYRIELESE